MASQLFKASLRAVQTITLERRGPENDTVSQHLQLVASEKKKNI